MVHFLGITATIAEQVDRRLMHSEKKDYLFDVLVQLFTPLKGVLCDRQPVKQVLGNLAFDALSARFDCKCWTGDNDCPVKHDKRDSTLCGIA